MPTNRCTEDETKLPIAGRQHLPARICKARAHVLAFHFFLIFDSCVLAACCLLFYANNLFLKEAIAPGTGLLSLLAHNHLNDFLGGIAFLGYTNLLLDLFRPNVRICKLPVCLAYIFACGLFWEYLAPFFVPGSVGDPLDLVAYVCGSAVYWALAQLIERKQASKISSSE